MAYEELTDVRPVSLGGTNKETGESNPSELEGYYVRKEKRPNKFNPEKPKDFFVFRTENGLEGVYGSGGVVYAMKDAVLGRMTRLVSTGESRDVGKGNPMKVFKAYQDRNDTIALDEPPSHVFQEDETVDLEESEEEEAPYIPAPVKAPKVAALAVNQNTKARVDALLKRR